MNKIIVRIVECSDSDYHYGFLLITSNEDLNDTIVQKKINGIKSSFDGTDLETDYTIEDIIDRLPETWDVEFYEDQMVEM